MSCISGLLMWISVRIACTDQNKTGIFEKDKQCSVQPATALLCIGFLPSLLLPSSLSCWFSFAEYWLWMKGNLKNCNFLPIVSLNLFFHRIPQNSTNNSQERPGTPHSGGKLSGEIQSVAKAQANLLQWNAVSCKAAWVPCFPCTL